MHTRDNIYFVVCVSTDSKKGDRVVIGVVGCHWFQFVEEEEGFISEELHIHQNKALPDALLTANRSACGGQLCPR